MKTEYEHVNFKKIKMNDQNPIDAYDVIYKHGPWNIGMVTWIDCGKYGFIPDDNEIFSPEQLDEISAFIKQLQEKENE